MNKIKNVIKSIKSSPRDIRQVGENREGKIKSRRSQENERQLK